MDKLNVRREEISEDVDTTFLVIAIHDINYINPQCPEESIRAKESMLRKAKDGRKESAKRLAESSCCFLYYVFYALATIRDWMINAYISATGNSHCEYGFATSGYAPQNKRKFEVYAVRRGLNSQKITRTFSTDKYQLVFWRLDEGEYGKIVKSFSYVEGREVSTLGMVMSAIWPMKDTSYNWCSKMTCLALQSIGEMLWCDPNSATPSDIAHYVTTNQRASVSPMA